MPNLETILSESDGQLPLLPAHWPVLAVCGWKSSGKTTLLEAIISRLVGRGLRVAALKHDAHGIQVDRPGKDSDRLFRAGADVSVGGPSESFARRHEGDGRDLRDALAWLLKDHDLVLVEGHKSTPLAKIWLEREDRRPPPDSLAAVHATLSWNADRPDRLLAFLDDWLPRVWRAPNLRRDPDRRAKRPNGPPQTPARNRW